MTIQEFHIDLREAAVQGRYSRLHNIKTGEYDGSISFTFSKPEEGVSVDLQAIVSDAYHYPQNHSFIVFSTSSNVVASVAHSLESAQPLLEGLSIHDVLIMIDRIVSDALLTSSSTDDGLSQDEDNIGANDTEMFEADESFDWGGEEPISHSKIRSSFRIPEELRRDLRIVKHAGFKVGYLGEMAGPIIVSVSCRIGLLGLSEEAMHAWNVRSPEYFVLLIRYPRKYQGMQGILKYEQSDFQMRVGLCASYKPTLENAVRAFQGPISTQQGWSALSTAGSNSSLRELFIGVSLNSLLNERLLGIVKLRLKHSLSWTAAEVMLHASQGKSVADEEINCPEYAMSDTWATPPPELLNSDHLVEMNLAPSNISFPLVCMQFTLRHFVKCTEFCLVCHCKTDDKFEALKPYVCSNGLCLYQYITYGMGPSLEYEIRSQPLVVDMLISLSYIRACSGLLKDFPTGLGLRVPAMTRIEGSPQEVYAARLEGQQMSLSDTKSASLVSGDWIAIFDPCKEKALLHSSTWHCRIRDIDKSSNEVHISFPICCGSPEDSATILKRYQKLKDVKFVVYNANFDDLSVETKRETISMLLRTLPSIDAFTEFLTTSNAKKPLSSWRDRVSPAALNLLRWIVASNRSCILQDSDPEHQVMGMDNFVQFRLVQGAPDKEHRFVKAVISKSVSPKHPTLFAWHGSPLHNWHSILREGLHFKETLHGRAFGNGVYLSNQYLTSHYYCGGLHKGAAFWPQSKLQMQSMLSLNEVVNCTNEFISESPHYVVQHLDWIQPRYLFVGVNSRNQKLPSAAEKEQSPKVFYQQDPSHQVIGPRGTPISIPISAISSARRSNVARHLSDLSSTDEIQLPLEDVKFDDCMSVATMMEDLTLLLSDVDSDNDIEQPQPDQERTITASKVSVSQAVFAPGSLNEKSLSLMAPPRYATTSATKVLQHHLQIILKVQEIEDLHELGWYVDPKLISTVYQWIVELHSFDPDLPLAKDLKAAKLHSVVLEIRFPPQFPMNPPFVRVIRPRFLEFAAGGGGNVTAGGAMCLELLTNSGWLPTISIESVLLQVRMALSNTEPRPGRLAQGSHQDYSVGEAISAFKRACLSHGWEIPSDVELMSW